MSAMNPDQADDKARLRTLMRRRRGQISPAEAETAAERAAAHLVAEIGRPTVVAIYSSIRDELDSAVAARRLTEAGISLAYPRVVRDERRLAFCQLEAYTPFHRGTMGILEPPPTQPEIPLSAIDLFVVPGLAFDRRGARVGWGAGYYDRTLRAAPQAVRVGYAFEVQLVENAPFGPGDAAMDCVITEAGAVRCARRAETE